MFDFSEKDSCGVGFIASRNIPPTHGMTLKVLECLANLDHRGAKFADGTGDGAGVLTEIPFELIRAELAELSIEHDSNKKIGIISCFYDPKNVDESIELINNDGDFSEIAKEFSISSNAQSGGLIIWRKLIDMPQLFEKALKKQPIGFISEPLKSGSGFHILKLEDKRGEFVQYEDQWQSRHILFCLLYTSPSPRD